MWYNTGEVIAMTKQQARSLARARRAALDLGAVGAAMAEQLSSLPCWRDARRVLGFVSLPDEPDTRPILALAAAEGKDLYLPRCLEGGTLEFAPAGSLHTGRYGIPEPDGAALPRPVLASPDTLILVPCLAADRHGTRLGRGAGYYDRFLAGLAGSSVPKRLLCPAALVLDELPRDSWDISFAPGEILTESGEC